jgi:protein-tyrosine phosphatase
MRLKPWPNEACALTERLPLPCTIEDLLLADLTIAVKEAEHRPLLSERFAGWETRVTYWHIHDLEDEMPAAALAQIDRHVEKLIVRLDDLAARS